MTLYRVYKKDDKQGTNWAVLANDTDEAKAHVCQHAAPAVTHSDLRIAFLSDWEKGYITVRTEVTGPWGIPFKTMKPLKEAVEIWKHRGRSGVMTEFKP